MANDVVWLVTQVMNHTTKERDDMQQRLTDDKSIYLQISQMIETDILRGILLEEERVPSTNELAKLYTINPATAAKGVNILVDDGILYKKRGIGMFVSTGAVEKIRGRRKQNFYEVRLAELLTEAKSLGITKEELIQQIEKEEK
jgi:DNA-binding transcriptional regulator YhcF (GntR family)